MTESQVKFKQLFLRSWKSSEVKNLAITLTLADEPSTGGSQG